MKTEKLNLAAIKNVLSRAEMKKIMAGSGGTGGGSGGGGTCASPGGICSFVYPLIQTPCCSGSGCAYDSNPNSPGYGGGICT